MAGIRRTAFRMSLSLPSRANLFVAISISLAVTCAACHQIQEPSPKRSESESQKDAEAISSKPADSPNKALLDEANAGGKWFHAKKTRPIWAKRLEAPQTVKTLEGEEQVAAGHYLCRGEAGDIWPQTDKDLNKRYTATDEVNTDGWRKYMPHPDAHGVMATPIDHPFEVQATWGKLTGKPRDFLVKNFQDRETAYPTDIWIVDQILFHQTYESVVQRE